MTTGVYLEEGAKRTFAGSIDWPGWSRAGRDADAALAALFAYGERYRAVVASARLGFGAPHDRSELRVIERVEGDATTDFGAPSITPGADRRPVADADLKRYERLLRACWRSFDRIVDSARGMELKKGPRGGGRELDGIVRHVAGADGSYVRMLGTKIRAADEGAALDAVRAAIVEALWTAPRDEPDRRGPRGGLLWTPRYAVRRIAWHVLDHAWEIEDRAVGG